MSDTGTLEAREWFIFIWVIEDLGLISSEVGRELDTREVYELLMEYAPTPTSSN